MKIIDLLNKIANDEEVPESIKYDGCEWFWCGACKIYETGEKTRNNLYKHLGIEGDLTDEVEILDEEDEFESIKELTSSPEHYIENTINQLIKNQKKIIEKLKED